MINLDNTEIGFHHKSNKDLRRAYYLFKVISSSTIVKVSAFLTKLALFLRLPIKGIIKATIFKQFCGGETINECDKTIQNLGTHGVGTILDYSVEGKESEDDFDQTTDIIIETILKSKNTPSIPFAVFKVSGICRFHLLEKFSKGLALSSKEEEEVQLVKKRIDRICNAAYDCDTSVFIDAEESWIQPAIDVWTNEMIQKYNKKKPVVYNTLQMYRHDRYDYLKQMFAFAKEHSVIYGVKLVRGAYMEKERNRALKNAYPSPIQKDKAATDSDYNKAIDFIVENHEFFALCAGTHNEHSSLYLADLIQKNNLDPQNKKFYFSQLLGMSDHISFNLANKKFQVAKYVPFGPVREVIPYLLRRAQENTSVAGQTGRELSLITKELKRRKSDTTA